MTTPSTTAPDKRAPESSLPIAVHSVIKKYGEKPALDGVSLQLRRGECLGLLGPNGAGKTTLIRCIVGRSKPDAGGIAVLGSEPGSKEARAAVGYIPQELALYPLLTPRENLKTFGSYQGMGGSELDSAITWCLEWAALADRQNEPVKTFSGGMKRRLNMAAGLVHRPKVVLMDEPTVGVDPQSRERIYEMIESLRRNGTSLIYTTHYMEEAQRLCDRVAIIDHGQVIALGSPSELISGSFGPQQQIEVHFLQMPTEAVRVWVEANGGTSSDGTSTAVFSTDNAAEHLPWLLNGLQSIQAGVKDIALTSPTLESVFLKLTGRELRE
jgi:ABC-2 type transport system ATP-binding protein